MKKIFIIFLFIIILSPIYAGVRVTGKVTNVFLSDNIVRFRIEDTSCILKDTSFYKIELDKNSTSKKLNTDFYFYYSLIVHAYKFQKDITLDLGASFDKTATCVLDQTDIWVNYMFINF